jgi:hypothetical protein
MQNRSLLFLLLSFVSLLYSCDMEKDIDIKLPEHTPQLVVECYLQPGKPLRLSLMESAGYFDSPQATFVSEADVFITHNGRRIRLFYRPMVSKSTNLFHTHSSSEIMRGKPGDIYGLEIVDKKGRKVTGFTTILPVVPIESVEWKFNEKDKAYLLTSFQDNPNVNNYYRYVTHRDSLHTDPQRSFLANDKLTNGKRTTFGSAYDYERNDNLVVTLFHIEKQYYDFLSSTEDARNANGNPFAQPSKIKSSVQGGIGIFTNLAFDRRKVGIK